MADCVIKGKKNLHEKLMVLYLTRLIVCYTAPYKYKAGINETLL